MKLNNTLSSSFKLGEYILSNRIVVAPASCLSSEHNLAQPNVANYYAQKASAGLIVTDSTLIAPLRKFQNCPGIYSIEQIKQWRLVTEKVHDRQGKIFLQVCYHNDMTTSDSLTETLSDNVNSDKSDRQDLSTVVKLFRVAAQNALAADFDGIEIQTDFGYAIDPSAQNTLKPRQNLEQLIQLLIAIIGEVASVWDEERVGIRIAPQTVFSATDISDLLETFYELSDALNFYEIAYVHLIESTSNSFESQLFLASLALLRSTYRGTIISGYQESFEKARISIDRGYTDLVSFNNLNNKLNVCS